MVAAIVDTILRLLIFLIQTNARLFTQIDQQIYKRIKYCVGSAQIQSQRERRKI